ncbi:hypothetical protein CRENBAI_006276 [Crenichthys baileyi]|uniref:Uncharacterized protein n=1 Tax=Crenichthys baileyi TaxID=28760 RepID=A0AAV9S032_9TELE
MTSTAQSTPPNPNGTSTQRPAPMPGTRPQHNQQQGNKTITTPTPEATTNPAPATQTEQAHPKQAPGQDMKSHQPAKPEGVPRTRSMEAIDADPHQHPRSANKNNRAEPDRRSPQAAPTTSPHILLCTCRGTVKTTNTRAHTPTRNIQQTANPTPSTEAHEPTQRRAALNRLLCRTAALRFRPPRTGPPRPNTTAAIQRRQNAAKSTRKQKLHTNSHCASASPTSPPKTKPPVKVHPMKRKIRIIRPQNIPTPIPLPEAPARRPLPGPTKGKKPTEPNQNPSGVPRPVHPETTLAPPAFTRNHATLRPLPPERKRGRHQ